MEKLVIIDGNSIAYRAFYGLPLLKNKNGEFTNAIFGFVNMLTKICNDEKPTHLVVVFDFPLRQNFRTQMYKDYKATRKPMPDELKQQMPKLKELIRKMGISIFEEQGFEADDVIGTLSKRFSAQTLIITGDRDCLQLVDSSTSVLLTKKGLTFTQRLTNENFKSIFGFAPQSIVDLKAVMGDASDNIPGVKGIGEKGACELIKQFETLENIYCNINLISPRQKTVLTEQKETAFLSKALATINTHMNIAADFEKFNFSLPFNNDVKAEFLKLEFFSLIKNKKLFDVSGEGDVKATFEKSFAKEIKSEQELIDFVNSFKNEEMVIVCHGDCIYIDEIKICTHQNMIDDGIELATAAKILSKLLTNSLIKKIVFDYKALAHFFARFGIKVNGLYEDVQVSEWLVSSNVRRGGLGDLLFANGFETINAINLKAVCEKSKEQRLNAGLDKLYREVELPCLEVLFEMEKSGIKISRSELGCCQQRFANEIAEIEEKIFELAGVRFNINSPKQVCEIIYDKLQIVKDKGKKSSDISVLTRYKNAHPIISLLISHRELFKLISTYIIPLKESADENSLIHTSFNLTGTVTGRLSSTNPNLQNIPTRSEKGKAIRAAFVSRFEGGKLVSADYNQIELRLLAHYSGDAKLLDAYNKGEDIHRATASEIFGIKKEDITPDVRRSAKAVNFGIVYGISPFGLSEQIGVSPVAAKEYIARYFEKFPSVKNYLENSVKEAKENGGKVTTLFGRIREISEIFNENFNMREFGKRAAMNFPLQGTASDIIKIAMIKIHKELTLKQLKARLVLQIHDELVCDTPHNEVEIVSQILKSNMESVVKLSLPLVAEVKSNFCLT